MNIIDQPEEKRQRSVRSSVRTRLDVWAAVEVCRSIDPSSCPLVDDATGRWEKLSSLLEQYQAEFIALNDRASLKFKNARPLKRTSEAEEDARLAYNSVVSDARLRVSMVEFLIKLLTKDTKKFAKIGGKNQRTTKDALSQHGLADEICTWMEVDDLINSCEDASARRSILKIHPRRGRWSGYTTTGEKSTQYSYRQGKCHRRAVEAFIDWVVAKNEPPAT